MTMMYAAIETRYKGMNHIISSDVGQKSEATPKKAYPEKRTTLTLIHKFCPRDMLFSISDPFLLDIYTFNKEILKRTRHTIVKGGQATSYSEGNGSFKTIRL